MQNTINRGQLGVGRVFAAAHFILACVAGLFANQLRCCAAGGPPTSPPILFGGGGYSYSYGPPGSEPINPNDSCETCPSQTATLNSCCGGQYDANSEKLSESMRSAEGMPRWQVSQPVLNVMLLDRPLWYEPSRGPTVAFDMLYKNLEGTNGALDSGNTKFFGLGTNWHTPWRAYVIPDVNVSTNALVVRGDGAPRTLSLNLIDYNTRMLLQWASPGYTLTAASGEKWVFNSPIVVSGVTNWFITTHADPQGNALTFAYDYDTPVTFVDLTQVADADNNLTTFSYGSHGLFGHLIDSVIAPDGRTAQFSYDGNGRLTNIVDMGGLSSGIFYDSTNNLRFLTTPYGQTSFSIWAGETGWAALKIAEVGMCTNFWLYLDQDSDSRMSTNFTANLPVIPSTLPSRWDTNEAHLRNTFYWSQRQIELLSDSFRNNMLADSFEPSLIVSNDFKIGRQRHWLRQIVTTVPGRAIAFQREPSPDGIADGQITWYDYEGKPGNTNWMEGTQFAARCIGWKLPDASARFSYWNRNALGYATNAFQSFDTGGGVRSNRFEFASNGIDMTRHVRYIGATEKSVISNVFNASHLVRSNWNSLEELSVFTYEGSNRMTFALLPTGLFTTNIYGSNGRLATTVDKDGVGGDGLRTNTYSWTNGWVLTHTDPRGAITTNAYDSFGRLAQSHDARGAVAHTYNKLDLIKIVDRMGFVRSNLFDPLQRLVRSADARNNSTSYRYCSCGSLDYETNALGEAKHFAYDNAERLTTTFYADDYNVTNIWNSMGELTRVCDNAGICVTNMYNQQGLLTSGDIAGGRVFSRTYDTEDHVVSSTDQNGVTITNLFDARGRIVVRGLQATNSTEGFAWHARGLLRYTNQLGHVTTNGFDALRRKVAETNANGDKVFFTYAPGGELLALTDGKSLVTTWTYDLFGRVTNKADNLGANVLVNRYDANDRRTYRWMPEKGDTGFTNDPNGNVTLINYSNNVDVVMSYDGLNRLTNMVDDVGTNRYAYNTAGLLASEDGPWESDTVNFEYTVNRQRNKMTLGEPNASDWVQTYIYDRANRLTNTTSPAGTFAYAYATTAGTTPGRLGRKLTLPSGAYITNGYDGVARMINTTLKNSSHSVLNAHSYEVDSAHQRARQTRYDNSYLDYTYDPIGQLKSVLGKESGGSTDRLHEQFRYTYDAAGNLSNRVQNVFTNTFNVNSLNELTTVTRTTNFTLAGFTTTAANSVTVNGASVTPYGDNAFAKDNLALIDGNNSFTAAATDSDGRGDTNALTLNLPSSVTFVYDLNGNLRTNGTRILEYGDENQLTRITEPGSWRSEFAYDGKLRRRIRKEYTWRNGNWVKTNEVHYIYDDALVVQERNELNVPITSLTRERNGALLAFSNHSEVSTYHIDFYKDENGNITALLDRNQQSVARYIYDPFGTVIGAIGPLAPVNSFQYSSKEFHAQSGLVYGVYRWYEPGLQRWVNEVPNLEMNANDASDVAENDSTNSGLTTRYQVTNTSPFWGGGTTASGNRSGGGIIGGTGPPARGVSLGCNVGDRQGRKKSGSAVVDCPCTGPGVTVDCFTFKICVPDGLGGGYQSGVGIRGKWVTQTECPCPEG